MQFLTIFRRNMKDFTEADFAPLVGAEVQQAKAFYMEGFLRQIWHRGDVPGACLLVEAESEAAVREKIKALPLLAAGMLIIDSVIPLNPYRGFAPSS